MPLWSFVIGDVFKADDPLAVWVATLGIAFNDLIHANNKVNDAKTEWERLYEWRIATGHYNEMCLHLQRGSALPEVQRFLKSEPAVKARHDDALVRYESLKRLTNRVRNEAAFHYAYKSGQRAVARALRDLATTDGAMGGTASDKIKDSRQLYADDLAGQLVVHAAGGSLKAYADAMARLGEGVAALGKFANGALDAYFMRHQAALKSQPPISTKTKKKAPGTTGKAKTTAASAKKRKR
jgi:hypothetical protein